VSGQAKGARERSQRVGLVIDNEQVSFSHAVDGSPIPARRDGTDSLRLSSLSHYGCS
jgi:hypothetical protein